MQVYQPALIWRLSTWRGKAHSCSATSSVLARRLCATRLSPIFLNNTPLTIFIWYLTFPELSPVHWTLSVCGARIRSWRVNWGLNASGGQSFKLPFRCLDKDFLGPVRVAPQFLRYLYLKPLESFYIKRGCCLSSISIFFSFSFSIGCI